MADVTRWKLCPSREQWPWVLSHWEVCCSHLWSGPPMERNELHHCHWHTTCLRSYRHSLSFDLRPSPGTPPTTTGQLCIAPCSSQRLTPAARTAPAHRSPGWPAATPQRCRCTALSSPGAPVEQIDARSSSRGVHPLERCCARWGPRTRRTQLLIERPRKSCIPKRKLAHHAGVKKTKSIPTLPSAIRRPSPGTTSSSLVNQKCDTILL